MLLKCPNPRFPFSYLASWSWTFWHWDISHVIWCELQSVISSQIKPLWPQYCRYCFFCRNSTCKMFWKKIGKKIIFAIRHKKAFFLDFYSHALFNWHQADFLRYIWCHEFIRDWDFLFVCRELPVFYFVFTSIIDILDAWNIYTKVLSEMLLVSTKSVALFNFIPRVTMSSPCSIVIYSIIFVLNKRVFFSLFSEFLFCL